MDEELMAWRGKPLRQMDRDELEAVLKDLYTAYRREVQEHTRHLDDMLEVIHGRR